MKIKIPEKCEDCPFLCGEFSDFCYLFQELIDRHNKILECQNKEEVEIKYE